jgi:hypothetical protein
MRFIDLSEVHRACEVARCAREYRKARRAAKRVRDVVRGQERRPSPDVRVNVKGSLMSGGDTAEWMREFGFGAVDFGR